MSYNERPVVNRSDTDVDDGTSPASTRGTIAVDMDDVLCQTNAAIVDLHNSMYRIEPPLSLDDFKHYLYWDNRGWGSKQETAQMVTELVEAGLYQKSPPVPGAKENLQRLKDMGYKLVIITARSESQRELSEQWIEQYMPDLFDEIHFTGAFAHLTPPPTESHTHAVKRAVVSHRRRSKFEVCHQLNALVLIDDSSENVLLCASADPPVPCLLFGDYAWNAAIRSPQDEVHDDDREVEKGGLTYKEKMQKDPRLIREQEERRAEVVKRGWLPDGVQRVKDWEEVVHWVENHLQ